MNKQKKRRKREKKVQIAKKTVIVIIAGTAVALGLACLLRKGILPEGRGDVVETRTNLVFGNSYDMEPVPEEHREAVEQADRLAKAYDYDTGNRWI